LARLYTHTPAECCVGIFHWLKVHGVGFPHEEPRTPAEPRVNLRIQ